MPTIEPTLIGMFLAGLLGSGHCLGMCGGIAGALGAYPGAQPAWLRALGFNLGRILGYAALGALAGALSAAAGHLLLPAGGLRWLRLLAALLLILLGLQLLSQRPLLAPLERLGARLWRRLAPLSRRSLRIPGTLGRLCVGLLWALLPCGLVYTALAAALTTANPLHGAATMFAFGLGTLPLMLGATAGGNAITRLLRRTPVRRAAGALILLGGLWTGWVTLQGMTAHSHPGQATTHSTASAAHGA